MKRLIAAVLLAVTCAAGSGCCVLDRALCRPCGRPTLYRRACKDCDPGGYSATVTYPYYTLHGPRDFLAKNPRGIGP